MNFLLVSSATIAAAAALLLLSARDAHAQVAIGADGDLLVPVGQGDSSSVGYGVGGRLGYRLNLRAIWLQPELAGGLQHVELSGIDVGTTGNIGRVMGGARVGLGRLLQPLAFAHVGAGIASEHGAGFPDAQFSRTTAGLAYDLGVGLDVKVSRFSAGLHATYNMLAGSKLQLDGKTLSWFDAGPHVEVRL